MHNPELYALGNISWQFFGTFTFRAAEIPNAVRAKMFFSLLRKEARICSGLHFKDLLWCLRVERGETFGRIHFHALIAGFPAWFVQWISTERMCQNWRKLGGGHVKVTVYDSRLDGVD